MTSGRHAHRRLGILLTAFVVAIALAPIRPVTAAAADPGVQPRADGESRLTHQVYGYLPYWQLNNGTAEPLDYRLLSTIAFFGIGIKPTGNIDKGGFGTGVHQRQRVAVTNAAHAHGVRVVPTFQLFDSGTLTEDEDVPRQRLGPGRFIAQAVKLVAAPQGRRREPRLRAGARVDAPQYVSFVARFNPAMEARFPGARSSSRSAGPPPA